MKDRLKIDIRDNKKSKTFVRKLEFLEKSNRSPES